MIVDEYKSGVKAFPIPLYCVAGRDGLRPDAAGLYGLPTDHTVAPSCARVDVAPNITLLHGYGVDIVGGVKVAWLSGTFSPDEYFSTNPTRSPFLYRHSDVRGHPLWHATVWIMQLVSPLVLLSCRWKS